MNITTGDIVTFTARNKPHTGTVVRTRLKRHIKRERLGRQFAAMLGTDANLLAIPTHTHVAEISVDGEGLWTIPLNDCTLVGKATQAQIDRAHDQKRSILDSHAAANSSRRINRFDAAKQNNLLNILPNQKVEVKFRDMGWKMMWFQRWTTTGKLVVRDAYGREGKVAPAFARLPSPEGATTIA